MFRTGSSGFRGLLLRTPTARSVHHTSAAQRLRWQLLELVLFGFYVNIARPPYARRGSADGDEVTRTASPLPLPGRLVRRRSTSAISFLRDDRARHESARRRQRAPVDAPRPVSERKPRSRVSRVSALGADHGKDDGRMRARRGGPSSTAGGSSVAAPPRKCRGCGRRSGQGHPLGILARVTLVTAVGIPCRTKSKKKICRPRRDRTYKPSEI